MKKNKKNWDKFFFNFSKLSTTKNRTIFFLNCPHEGAQGDAVYILSALIVFLKRMKQKGPLKVHPPNAGRGTLMWFNSIDCGSY